MGTTMWDTRLAMPARLGACIQDEEGRENSRIHIPSMGFQGCSVVRVAALKDHGNCSQGTSGLAKEIRSCNDGQMEMSWM